MELIIFILLLTFKLSLESAGDNSLHFNNCFGLCLSQNCLDTKNYLRDTPLNKYYSLLLWPCDDECRYKCMWRTVDAYQQQGLKVPQFYGKWPFVMFLTMQEPASTIFSLLNLYVHASMLVKLKREIRPGSPYKWLWIIHAIVCSHAWIWSAIFHARDTLFTEFMDYSCAYSIVMFSLYTVVMRALNGLPKFVLFAWTIGCLTFYLNHISYLYEGRFEYSYNMKVNITTGVLVILGWLAFALTHKHLPHTWKTAAYVISAAVTGLLEIYDAPPFWWILDSHAMWHLATVPVPYLIYSFAIEDCQYLRNQKAERNKLFFAYGDDNSKFS